MFLQLVGFRGHTTRKQEQPLVRDGVQVPAGPAGVGA